LVRGDELPTPLDYVLFDFAVNAGPGAAIKLLQQAVGSTPDGALGPITLGRVKAIPVKLVVERFSDEKEKFYKGLKQFPIFGKGWLSRVEHVEVNAKTMLA